MTIETATADVQLTLQRRATIAAYSLQRFAENAAPITAEQGADIDVACEALLAALGAAGFGTSLPDTQVVVTNDDTVVVKNSVGTTVPGTHKAEVAAGALTDVKLAATIAPVASGALAVAATGTGTTVTLTVTNGAISAVALS